jgi:hypothetical protein
MLVDALALFGGFLARCRASAPGSSGDLRELLEHWAT